MGNKKPLHTPVNADPDISGKNVDFILSTSLTRIFLNCYSKDIEQNKDADTS